MEIVMEGRNFRLVPKNELLAMLDVLEKYLPESIKFHQTIKIYLNNKIWDFKFYVAKNWPDDPICLHFPGFTNNISKNNIYDSIAMFCPSNRTDLLELVMSEDILIDLSQPFRLTYTHEAIITYLEKKYKKGGTTVIYDIYVLGNLPEDVSKESLPLDVELLNLRPEHIKLVYEHSPSTSVECQEMYKTLSTKLLSYGISVDGQLCAWVMHSYYGSMFSMHTLPEFRRKGYGYYLASRLTRDVVALGYLPFAYILPENEASRNVYTKLGFKKQFRTEETTLYPRYNYPN